MNTLQPRDEIFYSALSRRDSTFEGIFVVAVKTTGVFCRPTCPARMPKRENVEFFTSARDALVHGYRPCKVCKPMEYKSAPPDWLKPLLDEVNDDPTIKLKDSHLRERGLEPSRVRYWFKKHHGMTFQGYQRSLRIGQAFGRIKNGGKVTETAFQSGYGSLSGFADSFKKTADFSPSESQDNHIVSTTRILTPLGPMLAGATDEGICLLEFEDRRVLEMQIKRLGRRLRARFVPGSSKLFDELQCQLDEYFSGKRKEFCIPLVMPGTPFQKKVWEGLQTIPYGSTRSYKEQADIIGVPRAVRALAKANGDNSIAIVIPCHRVIGANGDLVGYGGGSWRKQFLLKLESDNRGLLEDGAHSPDALRAVSQEKIREIWKILR
jgi:AraC family transcriptional regulator of adaptative response/methylated-DNA-[protein]-cysteine methyltransferase